MTAQLAFARAAWLYQNGHADDGLKYLDQNVPQKPDSAWKINHARYLELTANPQAKKEWEDLAENNPTDVKIQWQALAAKSTQPDRPFIAATIDRLRNLRGDKGTFLSIMRARYILQGSPSDKDLAEVILLLSDVTRQNSRNLMAHQLLATAYFAQKNIPQAVEELSQAADVAPDDTAIALDLARLLHSQRDFSRARPYIDRVTQSKTATADQRRICAVLLAEEGDLAAAALEFELISPGELSTKDEMSLASLYFQGNQTAKADALVTNLLKQPTPEAIQLAVDLYGSQRRDADAQRVLAMLDNLDCPAALKSRIRAAYAARVGSTEDAIKQFLAVAEMTPSDPVAWRQLLTVCIFAGRFDDVDRYVGEACTSVPGDKGFASLRDNITLLHKFGNVPSFRQVFASMAQSPKDASGIVDALNLFSKVVSQQPASQDSIAKLRQAAQTSDLLAVQLIGVQGLMIAGRNDDAIDIASRAMTAFPNSTESAQAATQALMSGKRWNEALTVALQWRSRTPRDTIAVDVALAEINIQLGKAGPGTHSIAVALHKSNPYKSSP